MAIVCPNPNHPEYKHMKRLFGEEKASYFWSINNGNSISKRADGKPNQTFERLKRVYNDDNIAMMLTARTYDYNFLREFGDWTKGQGRGYTFDTGEPMPFAEEARDGDYVEYTPLLDNTLGPGGIVYVPRKYDTKVASSQEASNMGVEGAIIANIKGFPGTVVSKAEVLEEAKDTSDTEGIIAKVLQREGYINAFVDRFPLGVPVPVTDMNQVNDYMERNYGAGQFLYEYDGEIYVNPETLRRINNFMTKEIRGAATTSPRGAAIQELDTRIKKILNDAGIDVKALKDWKDWFTTTFGREPDGEIYAIMTHNLVLTADKLYNDSLPKAAAYFIVDALWGDERIRRIREIYLYNTDEYKRDASAYAARYNNDMLKVEKEIMADIFAKEMQRQYLKEDTPALYRAVRSLIRAALQLWDKIFKKNKVDTNTIPKAVRETIGAITKDFFQGNIVLTERKTQSTPRKKLTNPELKPLASKVEEALHALNRQKDEMLRLKTGLYEEFDRLRFDELEQKLGESFAYVRNYLLPKLNQQLAQETDSAQQDIIQADIEAAEEYLGYEAVKEREKQMIAELKSINTRIRKINSNIKDREYELGLYHFLLGAEAGRKRRRGAVKEIEELRDFIDGKTELEEADYVKVLNTYTYYWPTIADVHHVINSHEWELQELNENERNLIKQAVSDAYDALTKINQFMGDMNTKMIEAYIKAYNKREDGSELIPDLTADRIRDIATSSIMDTSVARTLGASGSSIPYEAIAIAVHHVMETADHANQETLQAGTELFTIAKLASQGLIKNEAFMQIVKDNKLARTSLLDGLNPLTLLNDVIVEKDENGLPTGYRINGYHLGQFEKAKTEHEEKVFATIESRIKKEFGIDFRLPRGKDRVKERSNMIFGTGFFTSEARYDDITPIRSRIKEIYNEMWDEWEETNTEPVDKWEEEVAEYRSKLTALEFEEWSRYNLTIKRHKDGTTTIAPRGILTRPAAGTKGVRNVDGKPVEFTRNDYSNKAFNALYAIPEFKETYDAIMEKRQTSLDRLPLHYNNDYNVVHRLTQLSQTTTELVFAKRSLFKKLGQLWEKVTDLFQYKEDDSHYANAYGSTRFAIDNSEYNLDLPPVRWTHMLDDPTKVSTDVLMADIMFYEMAAGRYYHNENAGMYKIALETTKRKDFGEWRFMGKQGSVIKGSKTNILKEFEAFMDTYVAGNRLLKMGNSKADVAKIVSNMKRYWRNINLQFNFASMSAGYLSGRKERLLEVILNKVGAIDSVGNELGWAKLHALRGISPLQVTKIDTDSNIVNFIRFFGVLGDTRELFRNTSRHRMYRMTSNLLHYFGWKQLDWSLKVPTALAIANNRRYIDGKWYTWQTFKEAGGNKAKWDANENNSLYRSMQVKVTNGKVTYEATQPFVTQGIIDEVRSLIQVTNSRLDAQPLEHDKHGLLYRHALAQMLSLHMGWLIQAFERRLKRKHFNIATQREEEGFYITVGNFIKDDVLRADGRFIADMLRFVGTLGKRGGDTFRGNKLLKEALIRSFYDMAVMYGMWFLAKLINRLAGDDRDGTWLGEFIAYLSTRFYLETSAIATPWDLFFREGLDRIKSPVAGATSPAGLLYYPIELITNPDAKLISKGPYKNMTKAQQKMIKAMPYYKGFYENVLHGPESFELKNQYLWNQVLNPPLFVPKDLP